MRYRLDFPGSRAVFALIVFAVLAAAILTRPAKWLGDFDQPFYLTIAYDLDRHGVYSNGALDDVDSTRAVPPPGAFFAPVYPSLLYLVGKIDPQFGRAISCVVEANQERRDVRACAVYALPMHLLHALFLAVAVLAIARAAELIRPARESFFLAGAAATAALVAEANLFSFVMTESLVFSLYSVFALLVLRAWRAYTVSSQLKICAMAGLLLGLLCLTRTAYAVLAPAVAVILLAAGYWQRRVNWRGVAVFVVATAIVLIPWALRNQISVGKFTLSEEYGAASLVERFAFNDMTPAEFVFAAPYCLPLVGPSLVGALAGDKAMSRFQWDAPGSFFETGRGKRLALVKEHKRLDPIIGTIMGQELRNNWWRHIAASIPLAWCGLWAGGMVALLLVPAFFWAGYQAVRRREPLFLVYGAPALTMLALHAAVANHYTRYNLILIGPFAVAAAWFIQDAFLAAPRPRRSRAPAW
ncbi:MAG: hypothetical protein JOZ70_03420 [Pseudolabrys sp.]|nr:hypothetical protein [Pseudolabrys sp.]